MQTPSVKFGYTWIIGFFLIVSLMFTGCGSRFTTRDIPSSIWCHANGFAEKPMKQGARYWVINASGAQGDLEFKEYGKILGSALADLGYMAADSLTTADVAILLSYGVSEPRSFEYTTSTPVFEYVAGKTTTYTAVAVTADSAAGAAVRITQPSQLILNFPPFRGQPSKRVIAVRISPCQNQNPLPRRLINGDILMPLSSYSRHS